MTSVIHAFVFVYLVNRENFERLIDEKTFRNEIVLFSIDSINTVVNEEHQVDLIPILMRQVQILKRCDLFQHQFCLKLDRNV